MSRLILCLRIADRPVPHVASVARGCETCGFPVWREADAESQPGDEIICNACYPGYEQLRLAVKAKAAGGLAEQLTELFRTLAKPYVEAGATLPAVNGKPGEGSN